ncbi:Glutathione S-transferase T2 [Phytophthora cinnamomi]|uniref:Glutathione S-transferase T2 n=1 Tax=Phytophthora cinnamomi TaxID=4785 RepID=UPI003559ED82|nr:Glutathione S-transferase T2 [Phytophthora cinnamomi]
MADQRKAAASASAAPASAGSAAPAAPPNDSPTDSASLSSSAAPAPPSMSMFYPLERDDSAAAALSIIEEGDEHDLGAEAFADMAMGGMDMSLELNALQIRAFLARSEAQSESGGAFAAAAAQRQEVPRPQQQQQQTPKLSAYEEMHNGTVHYSRREDKVRALQEHPAVASVAADGRTVGCKCGRNVRLNPPWYILKFEQHVASRNCTFLRQSRPSSKKRKRKEMTGTGAGDTGSDSGVQLAGGEKESGAGSERRQDGGEETGAGADSGAGQEHPQSQERTTGEGEVETEADQEDGEEEGTDESGLRDENVQAYVANAVQIVGGSRPRYVIARELFPRVFGNDKKVRIVDKLDDEQRLVLQDAVFSECLWRVDKEGRRSKVPKKLENIKYVPSVYTESDPFLRKLSKNAAFRGLYQTVKRLAAPGPSESSEVAGERLKRIYFWLRFARMGVFGHFKSHPVFEGLMKSMVEIKDKERRGVGKQNMQYSRALDEFMQNMAQISTEAFELFAAQFCGRTLRSQKVKRRTTPPVFSASVPAIESVAAEENANAVAHQPLPPPTTLQPHQHQHYLMPPDDLLSGRSLSTEESQRFMDRMMAEVNREMQLAAERRPEDITAEATGHEHPTNDEDDSNRVGPETYLNDEGVLTTEI